MQSLRENSKRRIENLMAKGGILGISAPYATGKILRVTRN